MFPITQLPDGLTGTVLANEEVINGLSERGNHPVVRQPLRQWVLKITQFADRLEKDLDGIQWPDGTLQAQKQWIGRSVGAAVTFKTESGGRHLQIYAHNLICESKKHFSIFGWLLFP